MLSEERIILMTRMASYEQGEGRKNVKIGNYFRSDYITIQVLKAVVCAIVAFLIVFGLYVLCNYEELMKKMYNIDELLVFAKDVLTYFCVSVGGYGVLTYIICTWRYVSAKKSLKCYYHNLKKLGSMYNER
ncbi:MAG TPA: hypothetical protein DCZ91_00450 [Lachnospiraceae bacterium]|nr:hypothetical protein [Lachnospiraceae bacterium]